MRGATLFALMLLGGCMQHGTPAVAVPGPEEECAEACEAKAPACGERECARGCRLAMDRLVEREQARLIACVARASKAACDDMTFADCAARSGPYTDGGPSPPKPRAVDDE